MNTSLKSEYFDDDSMWMGLAASRPIAVPLAWFPGLVDAAPVQRLQVQLCLERLPWNATDEDVSVIGLLAGHGDMTRGALAAA